MQEDMLIMIKIPEEIIFKFFIGLL